MKIPKIPLRILHLEDNVNDSALVRATLEAGGLDCRMRRVETRDEFMAALDGDDIDIILSDYSMPTFDGLSALKIARAKHPGLPVIFISGTLGEEKAIDSLKNGATDYILKGGLGRLAPAVQRAMQDVDTELERRRLEARFIEAQKMEVIGQLAGGVAHDFNNILAVIIGYNEVMMSKIDRTDGLYQCAQEIRNAAERAAGLTKQLLVFSRKHTVQPVVLNLGAVVQGLDGMLGKMVGENIKVTIIRDREEGFVCADNGYIGQVLMNLAVNARDAMPAGGQFTISVSNITLDQDDVAAHPGEAAGDFVMLTVSDTGMGMTDEVKARLFETFFTTKPVGKGTGLGLATCQIIVRQSGGHIRVSSTVGEGTTFRICFPRITKSVDGMAPPIRIAPSKGGTETVLLVEDEVSLRKLGCSVLEERGYKVLSAANGLEALRLASAHKGAPIRLVVTDVIMPVMDGKEMADRLTADYPGLKILFTSGYTDDAIAHHGVLDPGIELLTKPYTPAAFVRKVRELLDGRTTASGGTKYLAASKQNTVSCPTC